MTIATGMVGQAPTVLIQPSVRVPMTLGEFRKMTEALGDHVWVCLESGPVNKVVKDLGANEPFIKLLHLGARHE